MNETVDFYMEPMIFFKSFDFLSGSSDKLEGYEIIEDKEDAIKLIFDQDVPSQYAIWSDFFLISYLNFIFMKTIKRQIKIFLTEQKCQLRVM
ncbi:hypothetical protein [Xenorhabdus bovienii]|uniref:hypothetical protein n=1 Tax=Xenorhabdus bovienii TaxID=40576 RepID=UPI0023B307D5|nr:hypothetical protein [Xenorhabdus bovienii]